MKRAILIIIPSLVFGIMVFLLLQFFFGAPEKGALQVTATPQSKVYINGTYLGQTPLCRCDTDKMLTVGDYTLQITPVNGQFLPVEEKITINKSVLTVVDKTFAKGAGSDGSIITLSPLADAKKTQLVVVSIPDKASVLLDSAVIGNTSVVRDDVTDSDHILTLQKPGYKDKTIRIHTPAGYKLTTTITLAVSDEVAPTPLPSITPSISVTPSPALSEKVEILQTPNGFLRVRDAASLSGNEIGRVTTGETYVVQQEQVGWYEIKLTDGTLGWISSEYAQKVTATQPQ